MLDCPENKLPLLPLPHIIGGEGKRVDCHGSWVTHRHNGLLEWLNKHRSKLPFFSAIHLKNLSPLSEGAEVFNTRCFSYR
jgi:hypothetical protein